MVIKLLNIFNENRVLWFVCLIGFCIRLPWIGYGLPQQYHPDEWAYTTSAFKFFKLNFVCHGLNYPNLSMIFIFLAYCFYFPVGLLCGHFSNLSQFYASFYQYGDPYIDYGNPSFFISARLVSVLAITICGSIAGIWLSNRGSKRVAVFTILLFFLLPLEYLLSRFAAPDIVLTLFLFTTLILLFRFSEFPSYNRWIAACIASVCAVCSKQPGLVTLIPIFVALWIERKTIGRRKVFQYLLIFALIFVSGVFLLAPNMVVNHPLFHVQSIIKSQYMMKSIGTESFFHGWNNSPCLYFKSIYSNFGPIILPICLVGLFMRWAKKDKSFLIWLAMFIPYFAVFQFASAKIERYILPVTTLLFLFTFPAGLSFLFNTTFGRKKYFRFLLSLLLLLYPLTFLGTRLHAFQAGDTRTKAQAWLETQPHTLTLAREIHYTPLPPPNWEGTVVETWYLGTYNIDDLKKKGVKLLVISNKMRTGFVSQSKVANNYQSYFDHLTLLAHFEQKPVFGFYNPVIDIFEVPSQSNSQQELEK